MGDNLRQLQETTSVRPRDLREYLRSREVLQERQRFARQALAFRSRHKLCGYARAVTVGARAVAAEDQLVLMPVEKASHEVGIAVKTVVAGIGRHVTVQVGKFGQPFVC